jgi:serine protease Do
MHRFFARLRVFLCWLAALVCASSAGAAERTLAQLYQTTRSSVVVLSTEKLTQLADVNKKGADLRHLTRDQVGSGVLISPRLIMTAAHMVHAADKVEVTFADGHHGPARIIVTYPGSDLALLELEHPHKKGVPAILGDSARVSIGEPIYVIGAPYGISYTISRGIISGRHAPGTAHNDFHGVELFQTDAAINAGNSGGPMFNMDGEVIGIVSFIKSLSGGSEGLGFAVSIASARKWLLEKPPIYGGIEYKIVEGLLAEALNVPQPRGLLIQRVGALSLGQRLGIRGGRFEATIDNETLLLGGDVLLQIQGVNINDARAAEKIDKALEQLKPGQRVSVLVWRGGNMMELETAL